MPFAEWKWEYETGFAQVDSQHRRLFELINELHEGIINGSVADVVGKALRGLAKYTAHHFRVEESLMESHAYPGLARHKQLHRDLENRVAELVGQFDTGVAVPLNTLSRFLADWLAHHIKEEDLSFIEWFRSRR